MMKYTSIILLSIITWKLVSCTGLKNGEGDMLYKIYSTKSPSATPIEEGDLVEISAVAKTEEDSVIWNSNDYGQTAIVKIEKSIFKGDLFGALKMLAEGDSAIIKVNIDSMVNKMGLEKISGKYITYSLKVHKVIARGNLTDSVFEIKAGKFLKARSEMLRNDEALRIKIYSTAKNAVMQVTPSGLQYAISETGTGLKAKPGDTIDVHYTASFLSGKIFDSTHPEIAKKAGTPVPNGKPFKIISGITSTIGGLEEAAMLFPPKTRAKVIVPSKLAFGENGFEKIPAYTPLVYELEIVNIRYHKGKYPSENGAAIPEFALMNVFDNTILTTENLKKGKSIIVVFNSDCDHCQKEIQSIGAHYFAFKNINVYLVSNESQDQIQNFMLRYGQGLLSRKNVIVLQDKSKQLTGPLQVSTFPSIYIYDSGHQLNRHFSGQTEIKEIIKAISN